MKMTPDEARARIRAHWRDLVDTLRALQETAEAWAPNDDPDAPGVTVGDELHDAIRGIDVATDDLRNALDRLPRTAPLT